MSSPIGREGGREGRDAAEDGGLVMLVDDEPFLLKCGLIQRTPRGRVATAGAYRHLGLEPPTRNGTQTELWSDYRVPNEDEGEAELFVKPPAAHD